MTAELVLPEPVGPQIAWLDSPASRKVLRVGRRGSKTRFALLAGLLGHGPGWDTDTPLFPGVLQGGDVVWIAQTYTNLTTVLWREEIEPRMGGLPWVTLNKTLHDINIPGLGSLMLRSGEKDAIRSVRGIGKTLKGVIVDEAAWLDLRGALQDIILLALADNNGWLIIMSTTNAGSDGGYDDQGKPQIPSFFNVLCQEINDGKRSAEWAEFTGTAYDNPTLSQQAIDDLVAEYTPESPRLRQEVFAELLETGIGLALPGLRESCHIVPAFSPPDHWSRFACFDWGFHHPWAFGHAVVDEDGQVYGRETLTGRLDLPEAIDQKVRAAGVNPSSLNIFAGPDVWRTRVSSKGKIQGEFQGPTVAERLQALGWHLVPAADARVAGLNNLRSYAHIEKDGVQPRFVWMDTPGNRVAFHQCRTMTLDPKNPEDALKIDADAAGRGGDDCLSGDTRVMTDSGLRRIDSLVGTSGSVLTPLGWFRYNEVRQTYARSDVWRLTLATGTTIDATASHQILTPTGWRPLGSFLDGASISGEVVLAHESGLLPATDALVAPGSLVGGEWSDSDRVSHSPPRRESSKQCPRQFAGGGGDTASAQPLAVSQARSGGAADAGAPARDSGQGASVAPQRSGQGEPFTDQQGIVGEARLLSDAEMFALRQVLQNENEGAFQVLPCELQGTGVTCSAAAVTGLRYIGRASVYNMEVEAVHCFTVQGGAVVHNCYDLWRYGLMSRPILPKPVVAERRQGISMGFDEKTQRPKVRLTAEQEVEQMFDRARPSVTGGRYHLPRK